MSRQGQTRTSAARAERQAQSAPERQRRRILAALADGEVHGTDALARVAGCSRRSVLDRLRELDALVEVRRQPAGCALVALRERGR